MQIHYILIDFENVQVKSLALLQGEQFRIRVFLGPKNTRLPTELVLAMKSLGEHADYIVLDAGGHNALDFHITYYLGKLAANDPSACFHIISKDTGFDSLIKHMNKTGIDCKRSVSIEALPFIVAHSTAAVVAKTIGAETSGESVTTPKAKAVSKKKAQELVDLVLANLAKRKNAAPRTEKTLRSTIRTLAGTQCSDKEIESVLNHLLKKKYVMIDGTRVSYNLPDAHEQAQENHS